MPRWLAGPGVRVPVPRAEPKTLRHPCGCGPGAAITSGSVLRFDENRGRERST
jgi:hypothetical protein